LPFVFPFFFRSCFVPIFMWFPLTYPNLIGNKMLGCCCCKSLQVKEGTPLGLISGNQNFL
jgi:hypothetical protein